MSLGTFFCLKANAFPAKKLLFVAKLDVTDAVRGHPGPYYPLFSKTETDVLVRNSWPLRINIQVLSFFIPMCGYVTEFNHPDVRESDMFNFWSMSLNGRDMCLHPSSATWDMDVVVSHHELHR